MTASALPATLPKVSANDRFKAGFQSVLWASLVLAAIAHVVTFEVWPEYTTQDISYTAPELTTVELPPEISIPDAPAQIPRPANPIVSTVDVLEELTIAPTTFAFNPVSTLPPPPTLTRLASGEADASISSEPTFTPFTVAPSILNREEVARAMAANYPSQLRAAGIGGTVRVYFFIDAEGRVQDRRVHQSSGFETLDQAALEVAELYRFSPALNRDKKVPVWVLFPIEFRVR
ncbi:MAG: energy transducer TonB [Gemmatimonadetes bacterium]|nr:energy transducer TonB [Gemmatimonadota bacterium]